MLRHYNNLLGIEKEESMATRLRSGRAGVLAVVGGALCTLLAAAPARAVCVGDCSNTCVVDVSNMIVGVNIVLGNAQPSACPPFQNANGIVDVAQLIKGVNNLLNGCNPESCGGGPTETPTEPAEVATATPSETPTAPPTSSPTSSPSSSPTETPTQGPTLTPTGTPDPQVCVLRPGTCKGGLNNGQDCVAAAQCPAAPGPKVCIGGTKDGQTCTSGAGCPGSCAGGEKDGQDCTSDAGCPGGTCNNKGQCGPSCDLSGEISKIELNIAALPVPLSFAISGRVRLEPGDSGNERSMDCLIQRIDAINIPAIGVVCISPEPEPCTPAGTIDCDGGSKLGIDLFSNGNIGSCLSNAACKTDCDTYCNGRGDVQQISTCTGFCNGSTPQACNTDDDCLPKCSTKTCEGGPNDGQGCTDDAQCPRVCVAGANMGQPCTANAQCPSSTCGAAACKNKTCALDADCTPGTCGAGNGSCNGPDPVGATKEICQCQCANNQAGEPSKPGDFQCQLGASLAVENKAPCDSTDVTIAVGKACIPVTTESAASLITNANNSTGTVPAGGPILNLGNAVECSSFATGLTGLKAVGVVNFFGSALGDIATELNAVCK
jgi:hypothetical protein